MAQKLFNGTQNLGTTETTGVTLEVHQCGRCGIVFAFDDVYSEARREDHASWCCPNGHSFSFQAESEKARLKRERDQAQRSLTATRDLLHAEERSHSATRGHLTRQKKRSAAGVCPCCNRTFRELARHMKTKHPEYVAKAKRA
jgi:protein-arginine kinase activator protein McsA